MQACDGCTAAQVLPLTPNVTVLQIEYICIDIELLQMLSCVPLLRHVGVQRMDCTMWESVAPQTLQALRSLPMSITWRPLELCLVQPHALSIVQEVCAAFDGTPLAQAVSKLVLHNWEADPPIAALRASFPNVLHFVLAFCPLSMASSLNEAIAAWPMLQSISLVYAGVNILLAVQQHYVEAAARMAAGLSAGQPFEMLLQIYNVYEGDAARMDVLVSAIHNAGGGKVDVRWEQILPKTRALLGT